MVAFSRYENIFLAEDVNLRICAMLQKANYKLQANTVSERDLLIYIYDNMELLVEIIKINLCCTR